MLPSPLMPWKCECSDAAISHTLSMGISTFVNFLTVSPIKLTQKPMKVSEDLPGAWFRF